MRIVSLIENTSSSSKLSAEHGLSLYIEQGGTKILFDTGASGIFAENAERMKIDLANTNVLVLSHNHFDHTGGTETFLKINPKATIFAKAAAREDVYKKVMKVNFNIGQIKAISKHHPQNFIFFNMFQEIAEGFFLLTNNVFDKEFFCQDKSLRMKNGKKYVADDFSHETFGVIFPKSDNKKYGCVIVSSCSHNGIINIIETVKSMWKDVPILGIVGGFHLMGNNTNKINCSEEQVTRLAQALKKTNIPQIYTCHCTGLYGYQLLKETLFEQLQYLQTGEELEF